MKTAEAAKRPEELARARLVSLPKRPAQVKPITFCTIDRPERARGSEPFFQQHSYGIAHIFTDSAPDIGFHRKFVGAVS